MPANHKEQIEGEEARWPQFLEIELVLEFFISFVSSASRRERKIDKRAKVPTGCLFDLEFCVSTGF